MMTDTTWTRVEGMMIASQLEPDQVAHVLRESSVLAQLEWFEATPQLLGLNIAVENGRVATLAEGAQDAQAGITVSELASQLASHFKAEVRLGGEHVDALPQGDSPLKRSKIQSRAFASSKLVVPPHLRFPSWPHLRASMLQMSS